jgi:hypothetical protein
MSGKPKILLLCCLLAVAAGPLAETRCQAQALTPTPGRVLDESTEAALEGVNILVLDTPWGTASGPEGNFALPLPPGRYRIRFQMVGYADKEIGPVEIRAGRNIDLVVHLKEEAIPLDEVLVVGEREMSFEGRQVSAHFMEKRQVADVSGSTEDVLRTIQTLPGVVSPADHWGRVYVRGGRSSENLVILDRIFIYEPYHLGGAVSIFNPELIDHIEFYAGGFPAKYSQGLSSVLRVFSKTGMSESLRGDVSLSLISANAVMQGIMPGRRGHWLLSLRRSYHDKLMQAVGAFDNYVFPHFHDVQLKSTVPLGSGHVLTFNALSSGDAMKVELENPEGRTDAVADSGDLAWDNHLAVASLDWKWLISPSSFSHLTVAGSRQPFESDISGTDPQWFTGQARSLDVNADLTVAALEGHEFEVGLYSRHTDVALDINFKQDMFVRTTENSNVALDTTMLDTSFDKLVRYIGCYLQDEWQAVPNALHVGYGLRYEMINTAAGHPISPRFHFSYRATENTRVKFSWGHYYQFSMDPVQMEPPLGSNDLKPKRAVHYILGLEHQPGSSSKVRLEAYRKELSDLFVFGPQLRFTNGGRGSVQGVEVFYERHPSERLNGWASYAYSVARRKDMLGLPEYHPLQDQRHTASLAVNYRLDAKWRASLRWMVHSGRPYTPVLGAEAVVDSATGEITGYVPLEGPINSKRFPGYQRLDVRLDRFFEFDGWDMNVYLEILNVYNHKNVYDYSYTEDYARRISTYQFPLLPSVGLKVSF